MELSPRLLAIAKEVKSGEVVADIGTDHGYLPIYLTLNHISPKAFAGDINKEPLEACKKNAREYGVADLVTTIRTPGLKGIPASQVDVVVIAGMGGLLIKEILKEGKLFEEKNVTFLLQPMQQQSALRHYLYKENYRIEKDFLVKEGNKMYEILKVNPQIEKITGNQFCKKLDPKIPMEKRMELGFYIETEPEKMKKDFLGIKIKQQEKILQETKEKSGSKVEKAKEKAMKNLNLLKEVEAWTCK